MCQRALAPFQRTLSQHAGPSNHEGATIGFILHFLQGDWRDRFWKVILVGISLEHLQAGWCSESMISLTLLLCVTAYGLLMVTGYPRNISTPEDYFAYQSYVSQSCISWWARSHSCDTRVVRDCIAVLLLQQRSATGSHVSLDFSQLRISLGLCISSWRGGERLSLLHCARSIVSGCPDPSTLKVQKYVV